MLLLAPSKWMQLLVHEAPASEPCPGDAAAAPPLQHQQLNTPDEDEALKDRSTLLYGTY